MTAMAVVMANMIGTGVFTSLGFQLVTIQSGFAILMLWLVGGLTALCGALCYAELGSTIPRSGGEYHFLTRIYHPAAGFTAGIISSTIGFAAPVALAAMTFGTYGHTALGDAPSFISPTSLALSLIIILTIAHCWRRSSSGGTQTFFTLLKVVAILAFSLVLLIGHQQGARLSLLPASGDLTAIFSGDFGVSLIYVSYAYAGWNAATYLTGELANPQKSLPKILFAGTLIVTALYALLNAVFLWVAPISEMTGELEVGAIAAQSVFGPIGGRLTGGLLAFLLISTVSAMTIAGPRVLQVLGEDYQRLTPLSKTNSDGLPARAIALQSGLSVLFVLTATFDQILVFAGFILALNNFVTVFGLFVLRRREPGLERPFRVPFYPLVPIVFLALNGWTLVFVAISRPAEVLLASAVIILSVAIYWILKTYPGKTEPSSQ